MFLTVYRDEYPSEDGLGFRDAVYAWRCKRLVILWDRDGDVNRGRSGG